MKKCSNCERDLPLDSLFCSYCGTRQPVVDSVNDTTPNTLPEVKKGSRIVSIVRNAIIMAVAILLLVGSFFPTTRINPSNVDLFSHVWFDDLDMTFELNSVQYITLFFDSLKNLDPKDPEAFSDFYEEILEIYDELAGLLSDDSYDLGREEKNLINKFFYISLRLATQQDQSGPSISLVFSAAFGFVNLLLSIALFVVALLNLLATFNIIKRGKAPLYTWSLSLLTAAPASILALHFVGHLYLGGSLSPIAIWGLVCVILAVVCTMIIRYIFSKKDSVRNIVARSIALVLSIVSFCLIFSPTFSANFKSETSNGIASSYSRTVKVSHGPEFFEALILGEDDIEHVEQIAEMSREDKKAYFGNRLNDFSDLSKKEIESDYGTTINTSLLSDLLGAKRTPASLRVLSLTLILFILTAVCALLILWQSLYFFASGKHVKHVILIAKICGIVAASVALIMTIVLVAMLDAHTTLYIAPSYKVRIGAGIIILFAFTLGSLFCPVNLTKAVKKEQSEEPYEQFQPLF